MPLPATRSPTHSLFRSNIHNTTRTQMRISRNKVIHHRVTHNKRTRLQRATLNRRIRIMHRSLLILHRQMSPFSRTLNHPDHVDIVDVPVIAGLVLRWS